MSVNLAQAYSPGITGSFTGTGAGGAFCPEPFKKFNISISGINSSTIAIQRSFDEGSNWKTVQSISADAELEAEQVERGVLWRFNCTVYGSGTIACRASY